MPIDEISGKNFVNLSFDRHYLLVIAPFIIILNGIVILVFLSNKRLRKVIANCFVCSYACSDLIVGFVCVPVLVFGDLVTNGIVILYTLMVSLLTLAMSTYDRYIAVKRPFEYANTVTRKRVVICLLFTWLIPIPLAITPSAWVYNRVSGPKFQRIYLGVVISLMLVVAISVIVACSYIFFIGRRHLTNILRLEMSNEASKRRISVRKIKLEVKFVKLFLFLSATFAVFWFPTWYITFVDDVLLKPSLMPPSTFREISFLWLLFVNIVDPILFGLFQHQYREILFRWCRSCCTRCSCCFSKRMRENILANNNNNVARLSYDTELLMNNTNRVSPHESRTHTPETNRKSEIAEKVLNFQTSIV